jgi:hypothetical protein
MEQQDTSLRVTMEISANNSGADNIPDTEGPPTATGGVVFILNNDSNNQNNQNSKINTMINNFASTDGTYFLFDQRETTGDFLIECPSGGYSMRVHQFVLATWSIVLRRLLEKKTSGVHSFRENSTNRVEIDSPAAKQFVEILYILPNTPKEDVLNEGNVFEIFRLARLYECPRCARICKEFIEHKLNCYTKDGTAPIGNTSPLRIGEKRTQFITNLLETFGGYFDIDIVDDFRDLMASSVPPNSDEVSRRETIFTIHQSRDYDFSVVKLFARVLRIISDQMSYFHTTPYVKELSDAALHYVCYRKQQRIIQEEHTEEQRREKRVKTTTQSAVIPQQQLPKVVVHVVKKRDAAASEEEIIFFNVIYHWAVYHNLLEKKLTDDQNMQNGGGLQNSAVLNNNNSEVNGEMYEQRERMRKYKAVKELVSKYVNWQYIAPDARQSIYYDLQRKNTAGIIGDNFLMLIANCIISNSHPESSTAPLLPKKRKTVA